MKVFSDIDNLKTEYSNIAMALGSFDGIHVGHQSLIKRVIQLAKDHNGTSVVFTFGNHPLTVLAPNKVPPQIEDSASRIAVLEKTGVDVLLELPFTSEMAKETPEIFLEFLKDKIAPKYVVVGPNFSFGYKGEGTPKYLMDNSEKFGFVTEISPIVTIDDEVVSSTSIRKFIADGDLSEANKFLGRSFSYGGCVMHGDERGRLLGFPTANLDIDDTRVMLPYGAYVVRVFVEGKIYGGIANVGNNPTFEGCSSRLEIHILNFSGDIYSKYIRVEFLDKIRDEQKFSSVEELVKQLNRDKAYAEKYLRN